MRSRTVYEPSEPNGIQVIETDLRLPSGKETTWRYIKERDYVVVVPITRSGKVVMIRSYRLARDEVIMELPSGKLESFDNKSVEKAAKRELQEEVGRKAKSFQKLATFHPWNYCTFRIHVFLATGLTDVGQNLDEEEFLEIEQIDLQAALARAIEMEGNAQTYIALLLAERFLRSSATAASKKSKYIWLLKEVSKVQLASIEKRAKRQAEVLKHLKPGSPKCMSEFSGIPKLSEVLSRLEAKGWIEVRDGF